MRRRATIVALTLVVALTGCGVIPGVGPDPRVNAVPVDAVTCPETYDDGYAEAGLVPPDFAAVAILRCDPYASWQDADGTWSGAVLERLEGDLDPVLAALATPSDPLSIGACTTVGYILPELWVENEDGLVVRVALPSTGCGAPKSVGLNSALDTLTVVETTTASASLMESAAATAAGCASQAGLLILQGVDGDEDLSSDEHSPRADASEHGGSVALIPDEIPGWTDPAAINGARVCTYAAAPARENSPTVVGPDSVFVGARELNATDARAIVAAARHAPAAAPCADSAQQLVVVHPDVVGPDAAPFTVELDGCQRLVDPAFRARVAPAEVLAALVPMQ